MSPRWDRSVRRFVLVLLLASALPALAADPVSDPSLDASQTVQPPPPAPAEPIATASVQGDCQVWCGSSWVWYDSLTKSQCCYQTHACPGGGSAYGYAWWSYIGDPSSC